MCSGPTRLLVITCVVNELAKRFWEKGSGEIKEIFKTQKGNLMMGDQRPLAEQQIRALNAQSDRLHTGKLSRSSQPELRMRITQRIS